MSTSEETTQQANNTEAQTKASQVENTSTAASKNPTQEESKEQDQKPENQDIDDLDGLVDDQQEELNVTADERSQADDDDMDPQMKQEYEKFMQEMSSGDGSSQMNFLNQMMGNMFSDFGGAKKEGAGNGTDQPKMPDMGAFQNQFGDMFKNFEDNPEYDALANHLLQEFMDKDILEEPLVDSQKKYIEYLATNKSKLSAEEVTRYENQQRCIDEILTIVRSEPNNKDKMIAKFEEMQEYGQPPEPLVNAFGGDSPFAAFTNPQAPPPGQSSMPNMPKFPGSGAPGSGDECRIF